MSLGPEQRTVEQIRASYRGKIDRDENLDPQEESLFDEDLTDYIFDEIGKDALRDQLEEDCNKTKYTQEEYDAVSWFHSL